MKRLRDAKRSLLAGFLVFLSYGILTSLLFAKFAVIDRTGVPVSASSDSLQQVWFVAWPASAIRHGWNPFVTGALNAPFGINLMNNTSMLLLGTLAAPLTWVVGPVATYLALLRIGFTLGAFSAALASKMLGLSWKAAWLVGLLVGFSAYRVNIGQVHLFAAFDVTTPWIFYGLIRLGQRKWSPRRFGLIVGGLIGFGGLISLERATKDAVIVMAVLLVLGILRRRTHHDLIVLTRSVVVVGATAGLILAVPLWYFQFGDYAVSATKHSKEFYQSFSVTIESLLLPGTGNAFAPFGSIGKGAFLAGGFTNGSYFGAAFLLLGGLGAWLKRASSLVRAVAIADVVLLLLSFGASVRILSVEIPLPGALLTYLPGLSDITPCRWMNEAVFATAFLSGIALDACFGQRLERRQQLVVFGLCGLTILSFIPNKAIDRAAAVAEPWFQTPTAARVMAKNPVVLTYPSVYDFFNGPMLDQAVAGINYRIVGGQAIAPALHGGTNQITPLDPPQVFSVFTCSYFGSNDQSINVAGQSICPKPKLTPETTQAFRRFIEKHHVEVIVWRSAGADPVTPRTYLRAAFGEGHHDSQDLVEWWTFRSKSPE